MHTRHRHISGFFGQFTLVTACAAILALAHPSAQTITDAHIAHIVVTANQVDIDAGALVDRLSSNADVKTFAQLMVTAHTAVNKAATDLAGKLKVTPQDNTTSQGLKAGGDKNLERLRGLTGAALDRAYIANEVTYHAAVIDALDKVLIPNASNAELKALLASSRPAFVAHLEHARQLQTRLGR
jgi:putative membrane protein